MLHYKICRLGKRGPEALFHATAHGTKHFPIGEWLEATDKIVRDGSGNRYYRSGFHTFASLLECQRYLSRFRSRGLIIVEAEIGGEIWKKAHSRANVILSTRLRVVRIVEAAP